MGANFTPSWNRYSDIKPFRFWCQKVLPTVYDDSLSYYELLCKVVGILNKVIEDMEKVEENTDALLVAFEQLQDYVNNYFDNIDFQELVNNSLDEMAGSGELEELVRPYFDAWIAEAEAWATGEKNGVPVSADDPQYHDNAKYYSQESEDFAGESEAWARGTKDGVAVPSSATQYQNNSKYYAEQAAQSAQSASQSAADATYANEAQAWATGEVNGTPVTSDKPQYENNAEYYANQAASAGQQAAIAEVALTREQMMGNFFGVSMPLLRVTSHSVDPNYSSYNYPGLVQWTFTNTFDETPVTAGNYKFYPNGKPVMIMSAAIEVSSATTSMKIAIPFNYNIGSYNGKPIQAARLWDLELGTWVADGEWWPSGSRFYFTNYATIENLGINWNILPTT